MREQEMLSGCPFCPRGGALRIEPEHSYPWHRVVCDECGVKSEAVWSKTWRDTRDPVTGRLDGDDADARAALVAKWNTRGGA